MNRARISRRARVALILGTLLGIPLGFGFYTFGYSKGSAYLRNDPKACTDCHVMQGQYNSWQKSAHKGKASCNDCHTPPGSWPGTRAKLSNGLRHSIRYATGKYREPLEITPSNLKIVEASCRRCHERMLNAPESTHRSKKERSCLECHGDTGHMQ